MDRKNDEAVLSEAMPDGVSRPTTLSGFSNANARSTNNEYRFTSPRAKSG